MRFLLIFLFLPIVLLSQNSSLYTKGKEKFFTGNYGEALNNFLSVKDDQLQDLDYFIAMSYFNLRRYKEAILYFDADLKKNKSNLKSLLKKAESERFLGNYMMALIDAERLLSLNPDYFMAHYTIGEIYFDQKNYKDALLNFEKATRLHPDFEKGYYKMGFCYFNLKDTISACNCWKKLQDPDDFEEYKIIEAICK